LGTEPVVLITEPIATVGVQLLKQSCRVNAPWADQRRFNDDDLKTADAIIVRLVPIDGPLLHRAPNLKVIGRHGVGLDNVDIDAATARRIPVVYTPDANTNAVAEHAVHLMLSLARHALGADRAVREGRFDRRNSLVGLELRGKTLGVVGLGAIGSRVSTLCSRGFGMQVLAFDPYVTEHATQDAVRLVPTLRELLERADIITLHLPLTAETSEMINAEALHHMKPSALLINTARGGVIDSVALAEALARGEVRGAGLDVFEETPLPPDHPLLTAPHTFFSAHIASSTTEAMEEMSERVARQVIQVLTGERPECVANPEVYGDKAVEAARSVTE